VRRDGGCGRFRLRYSVAEGFFAVVWRRRFVVHLCRDGACRKGLAGNHRNSRLGLRYGAARESLIMIALQPNKFVRLEGLAM
jgi:hypothetical protein